MINLHQCIVALIGRTANRVSYKTDGRGRWLASVPTLHSRRILPQPRCSGSYLARNGCPLAVDRLHSRSLKGNHARFPAGTLDRIEAVLRERETWADFLRSAIER